MVTPSNLHSMWGRKPFLLHMHSYYVCVGLESKWNFCTRIPRILSPRLTSISGEYTSTSSWASSGNRCEQSVRRRLVDLNFVTLTPTVFPKKLWEIMLHTYIDECKAQAIGPYLTLVKSGIRLNKVLSENSKTVAMEACSALSYRWSWPYRLHSSTARFSM